MKLWLLKRNDEDVDYDEFAGFVIRAPSPKAARTIAAEQDNRGYHTWTNPKNSTCIQLKEEGRAGLIISDYRAG